MDAAATPGDIGPGTVIAGTYRIERVLGEGGMGLVYEASHLRVPRRVAVKVLRSTPDRDQLARFRQEAEVASKLQHPGIVDVIDFNTLPNGAAYLVMEMLDGESLGSRLRARGKLTVAEALPLIRQIAAALHAAHCAGIIHRDLKPENVFLVPREHDGEMVDEVKLLDFGISKVSGGSAVRTRDDVVLGTPRYMAPEQATAKNDAIDPRADQFALGVMVYEMLGGRPPFDGDNGTQVMFKIVYESPPPLASLAADAPANVIAAIERAMQKEPHRRFDDLSQFVLALTGKPLAATDRSSYPVLAPPPSQPAARDAATVDLTPGRARGDTSATGDAERTIREGPDRADHTPLARRGRRSMLLALGGGVLVVLGILAGVRYARHDEAPGTIAVAPNPQDATTVPTTVAVATADAQVTHGETLDAALDATPDLGSDDFGGPFRPAAPHDVLVELSPDVLADLTAAEHTLRAGKLDDAEAEAMRIVRDHPAATSRAYMILVEVACARHDLASAQGRMREVPYSKRAALHARCKKYDFDLVDPR
ncbi:MAG TPA: serine/threonine-protein kinase [Kofleriaceae bacterium]|nr:serine/threonine-protein kinase [Kofleriaceae bacterium]